MRGKIFPTAIFLILGFLGGALLSNGAFTQSAEKVYKNIDLLMEVMKKISDNYVEPVGDDELLIRAIRGMVQSLDPFSAYLSPEELRELNVETKGEFGGLGIEITKKDYYILVISPIEGTPAWRAGIKPGDRIIEINGEPTRDMSLMEAVKKLRGPRGTTVTITIEREGVDEPIKITITRDIIRIKAVKSKVIYNDILYIRLISFQQRASDELLRAMRKAGVWEGKISGVILDLRNNPGGLLSEALRVSDIFLSEGIIVITQGRDKRREYRARAQKWDFPKGVSLIVLINRGSASASEIVAGAIKDNGVGILVGTRTFGKASVQTIFPLSNGGALRITTAHYFTPNGTNIEKHGVDPHIKYKPKKVVKLEDPKDIVEWRQHPEWDEMVQFAVKLIKGDIQKAKAGK